MTSLSLFCWNIANPSTERVEKQFKWLRKQPSDIFLLTETKNSEGCKLLEKLFYAYGYNTIFPKPFDNEYGVMIASKHNIKVGNFSKGINFINSRISSCEVLIGDIPIEIIVTYIPSRDSSELKIERKRRFIDELKKAFLNYDKKNLVFCGDLNILEPNHVPHYSFFKQWEYDFYDFLINNNFVDSFRMLYPTELAYSWIGRTNDGYRYDHTFVSKNISSYIDGCYYNSEPVELKLSDHSAIISNLKF
ncbi:endonuclease/exonuclease/phosphatase family protein [Runella limosa]|uniref:endonuclease/exonuclease/phosphatase family protein n=1 Tax=Runella limosa TaxID=370978 RepID=UPI00040265C7|nr:endonuclease/exonuclease/phosphatase family protein [Runella limosa]